MTRENFLAISAAYAQFTRNLLSQGRLPLRSTSAGFWNPAADAEVYEGFKKLGLGAYRKFLDIGSGDGRVVLIASLFIPTAEGVEIDQELHHVAHAMSQKLGYSVVFHCKDAFSHSFSDYDVLFINPDTPLERGMEDKLLAEMKGDLILYGHHFHPRFLHKKKSVEVNGTPLTVYSKFPSR